MTKGIGLPCDGGLTSEAVCKIPLAFRELARQRFHPCQIGVRLNISPADHIPSPTFDVCDNALKSRRIGFFDVSVKNRLARM